jgi:hypothetical protein
MISTELLQVSNGWREEFTKLIEQMTQIADGMRITKIGVETVCNNHEELAKMLGEDEESSEFESTIESSDDESDVSSEKPSKGSKIVSSKGSKK